MRSILSKFHLGYIPHYFILCDRCLQNGSWTKILGCHNTETTGTNGDLLTLNCLFTQVWFYFLECCASLTVFVWKWLWFLILVWQFSWSLGKGTVHAVVVIRGNPKTLKNKIPVSILALLKHFKTRIRLQKILLIFFNVQYLSIRTIVFIKKKLSI